MVRSKKFCRDQKKILALLWSTLRGPLSDPFDLEGKLMCLGQSCNGLLHFCRIITGGGNLLLSAVDQQSTVRSFIRGRHEFATGKDDGEWLMLFAYNRRSLSREEFIDYLHQKSAVHSAIPSACVDISKSGTWHNLKQRKYSSFGEKHFSDMGLPIRNWSRIISFHFIRHGLMHCPWLNYSKAFEVVHVHALSGPAISLLILNHPLLNSGKCCDGWFQS